MNQIFMYCVWSSVAVAALMSSFFLFRLMTGLSPLIARVEAAARWLEAERPRYDRILQDLEKQMGEMRGISASAHGIAGNAQSISEDLRSAAQPIIAEVRDLAVATRQVHAVVAAVRTGLSVLFFHRRGADSGPDTVTQTEPES